MIWPPLDMNLLRRFETLRGHPLATDRHPLTGIGHPIYQRLYRHGAVHQADAGVGGVAVDAGIGKGGVWRRSLYEDHVIT